MSELSARQSGRISRSQLESLGAGKPQVDRWLRDGYLQRVLPAVYAVGHTAPSVDADLSAALLYAGRGAVLSHATGAWWWGLQALRPATIDVTVAHRRRSTRRIRVHDRRERARVWRQCLPVTTITDTLLDYAAVASESAVRKALAEAEFRGVLRIETVDAALGRGRVGSARLRAALERHRPELALTRSELERAFLGLCEDAGLPLPEINGRYGQMTVDAIWRQERLVVELDGYRGHRTRAQIERDRRRELRLRAGGYTVIRYTWSQIVHEAAVVVADLMTLLGEDAQRRLNPPARSAGSGSR